MPHAAAPSVMHSTTTDHSKQLLAPPDPFAPAVRPPSPTAVAKLIVAADPPTDGLDIPHDLSDHHAHGLYGSNPAAIPVAGGRRVGEEQWQARAERRASRRLSASDVTPPNIPTSNHPPQRPIAATVVAPVPHVKNELSQARIVPIPVVVRAPTELDVNAALRDDRLTTVATQQHQHQHPALSPAATRSEEADVQAHIPTNGHRTTEAAMSERRSGRQRSSSTASSLVEKVKARLSWTGSN